MTVYQNLDDLFYRPEGHLYNAPMELLRRECDEQTRYIHNNPSSYAYPYDKVVEAAAAGASTLREISGKVAERSAKVLQYIGDLLSMGILMKLTPFSEGAENSSDSVYRVADNSLIFWYRYVLPNITAINVDHIRFSWSTYIMQLDEDIGQPPFEQICRDYLRRMAQAGRLPIRARAFTQWRGYDPEEKQQTDFDVIAADSDAKSIIIGECQRATPRGGLWRSRDVAAWMNKTHLLAQYTDRYYCLFFRSDFPDAIRHMAAQSDRLRLVTADMLFDLTI